MRAITLQLPHPSPNLRSNGSFGNSFVYRKAFREAKAVAVTEAERVLGDHAIPPPRWAKARYVATWFHTGSQRPDYGNAIASFKAYEDGIAAAKIITNDKYLRPEVRFEKCDRMPRVEITIEEEF